METTQHLRKVEWPELLFGALAIGLGTVVGLVVSGAAHPFLAFLFAGVGLVVVLGTLARPEWGLLFLVLLVYTRLSDVLVHEHGAPSIAQSYIPLLLLAIFVRWALFGERPGKWGRVALLVGAYGLVGFASLLYASEFSIAWETLIAYAKDSVIAIVVVMLLRRPATFRRVIWTLLAAAILLGTLSIYQQLSGTFENNYLGFAQARFLNIVGRSEGYRIGGPVGSPNFFAQLLLVMVPLALDRLWNERSLFLRLVAGWALVASAVTIFFTFSRGDFSAWPWCWCWCCCAALGARWPSSPLSA